MDNNAYHNRVLLSDVEETGLLTLYCRALDAQKKDPILNDRKALEMARALDPVLRQSSSDLVRRLPTGKIDPRLVTHIALRALQYDAYVNMFLAEHPSAVLVNLGCGLDTRFFRVNNGTMQCVDLDLPDMIEFKRKLLPETNCYQMIGCSVFDTAWMDVVDALAGKAIMFQAEGVFMYLEEEKVRNLLCILVERFPGSEMVCEVVSEKWVKGFWRRMASFKKSRQLHIGKEADYQFGLEDPTSMEEWHAAIRFLDAWSYFESEHPKLGWMKVLRRFKLFNRLQYTVHYKLGEAHAG